jgi:hypothetical protein
MSFSRRRRCQTSVTFVYVSGRGTEQGKPMRARVKGKTENDLLKLPFKAAYMFRPARSSRCMASGRRQDGFTRPMPRPRRYGCC